MSDCSHHWTVTSECPKCLRAEVDALAGAVEAYEADAVAYRAEVERLRGIVQADLEQKAEAWGEVERLRAALIELVDACEEASCEVYENQNRLDAAWSEARHILGLVTSPGVVE